jgi:hypothetical protein
MIRRHLRQVGKSSIVKGSIQVPKLVAGKVAYPVLKHMVARLALHFHQVQTRSVQRLQVFSQLPHKDLAFPCGRQR